MPGGSPELTSVTEGDLDREVVLQHLERLLMCSVIERYALLFIIGVSADQIANTEANGLPRTIALNLFTAIRADAPLGLSTKDYEKKVCAEIMKQRLPDGIPESDVTIASD